MALFCVISENSGSFRAHCVKVHVRYLICWWVLVSYLILSMRMFIHAANKKYGTGTTLRSGLKTHRPISVLPTTSRAAGCLCFSRRRSTKDTGLYHVTRLDLNVKKLASYSAARSFTRRTYKMRQNDSRWNRDETIVAFEWSKLFTINGKRVKGVIVR